MIDTSLVQALIGYDAEIVVGRYTKIETSPAGLLTEIVSVILASIEDDSMGNGLWKVNEDGKSGFACNRFSRDPGRSSNGGDYFYYRQFEVTDAGVLSRDSWSADFYLDPAETLHKVDIANLQPIFDQAVEIVKAILSGDKAHVCSCCGRPFAYVKK